ncbi:MAG: Na-K-Cl cotransporter [Acidimicrobiia bacterium]
MYLTQFRRRRSRPRRGGGRAELGTFLGVFTPSILTILGVILFLRTGWVVGNVGLGGAVVIVVIANVVTLGTAMSVAAVATNMRVGPGGAYYMISRSLGVEIGAAVGIPLFLAQAFSVTLYAFGLAESLQLIWADVPLRPVAAVTVVIVSLLATRGASLALRLQLPIMGAIALSLAALAAGMLGSGGGGGWSAGPVANAESFWRVFAVFFPAVTGILAGISLSGDLARPERSIPLGTIGAVLVGFVVYLGATVGLGLAASPEDLVSDNLIWFTLAGGASIFIYPGLWGAVFSSAVGSVLAAPRTLQAMADDRILPRFIGARIGGIRGPGVPLVASLGVALWAVALGDLNAVAPVLTMFFLTTYGTVNLVAGVERLAGDPSYRPTVRVHWLVSLSSAAACFWVMFLISPAALAAAVVVEVGVYVAMRRRALVAPWGDLRRGALTSLVRSAVLQLRRLPRDPRNWRPNVLLFAGDVARRPELVRYGAWLVQDRGILTVAELCVGPVAELAPTVASREQALNTDLAELGVVAFGEVEIVDDFERGAIAVAQANGIAGIESNTVMFGWSDKPVRRGSALRITSVVGHLGISSVICRPVSLSPRRRRTIHVWWGGLQHNGDMLALLAHLLSLNPPWRDAHIAINSIVTTEMMLQRNRELLQRVIDTARIDAETDVILKPAGVTVQELMWGRSHEADAVFLGLRSVKPADADAYAARLDVLMAGLPTVLLVHSAGEFRGRLLGEHAGRPGLGMIADGYA